MKQPTPNHIAEVHELALKAFALVKQASSPAVALNALLTAYINTADQADVLDTVTGAGLALGSAAEQLLALRRPTPTVH